MCEYAGRSHDERVAQRKRQIKGATQPPGGDTAVHGTEPDATHSSGELSEQGKEVWRKGAGMDGAARATESRFKPPRPPGRIVAPSPCASFWITGAPRTGDARRACFIMNKENIMAYSQTLIGSAPRSGDGLDGRSHVSQLRASVLRPRAVLGRRRREPAA